VVNLTTGAFRGIETNGTHRFTGIPYAQQPVGKLRFKAPVKIAKPFVGIQDASQFGHACPQPPSSSLGVSIGEDCLFLNVCFY
jgi:carboxylesterase type B